MNCSTPGFPVPDYLLDFVLTLVLWVSDGIQPSHPLFPLLLLPSVFPSIGVFSSEPVLCHRWPKYWSFSSAPALPMNIQDWFPLGLSGFISLLSMGRLSSSPAQFKSSISLVLSLLYGPTLASGDVTTGKIIALTIWTFVGKVMSLLVNTVFRFVTAILKSKRLLILWLQSPSTLILELNKMKSDILFPIFPHLYAMEW